MAITLRWIAACWLTGLCLLSGVAAAQAPSNPNLNAQLLVAGRQGDLAQVSQALARGAAPNSRNRIGKTVLLMASEKIGRAHV